MIFETARLRCRRLSRADVDALEAVYGDADAMRWVGKGQPLSRADCVRWVDVTEDNYRKRGYGMFVVIDKASDTIAGFCGLVHPGGQLDAEIKYAFRRDCWGRGFATEAARALIGYGAASHGLRKIIATASPHNHASHRVLEKAGMRRAYVRDNDDGSKTQVFEWNGETIEA